MARCIVGWRPAEPTTTTEIVRCRNRRQSPLLSDSCGEPIKKNEAVKKHARTARAMRLSHPALYCSAVSGESIRRIANLLFVTER